MFRAALHLLAPAIGRDAPRYFASQTAAFSKNSMGIIGACFEKGQIHVGVGEGPRAIRETGVLEHLAMRGLDIQDYGDVHEEDIHSELPQLGPAGERNHIAVLEYNRRLSAAVSQVVKDDRVCVTLGGDRSISIGTINGHAAARPDHQVVVLWVDAHADLNTGSLSPTGNMHEMPLAHHFRYMAQQINRLRDGWPQPCLDAHHLVCIGLRDVLPAERALMEQMGVVSFGIRDVDRLGFQGVLTASLAHLRPSPTRPLHLSFDIDALDPLEAPSTSTTVRGGLTLREGLALCEAVHETGYLGAMDIVELNPLIGSEEDAFHTATAARLLMLSALAGPRTSCRSSFKAS